MLPLDIGFVQRVNAWAALHFLWEHYHQTKVLLFMCQPYIITSFTYYIAIFVNVRWWKLIFLNPCLRNKEGSFMGLNFCRCRSVLSVFVSIGTLTHLMALDPRKINHFP